MQTINIAFWIVALLVVLALLLSGAALAQDLPRARPEEVGLSPERLERVGRWLQAEIDGRKIPGAVLLIDKGSLYEYRESLWEVLTDE